MFEALLTDTTTQGATLFTNLFPVARHTPMTMIITPQGERLKVIIQPKPTDAKGVEGLTQPIVAVGTPEELDAELPGKLAEYAAAVNGARAEIRLPTVSADKAKEAADRREKKKAEKAAAEEAARKAKEDRKAKRRAEQEEAARRRSEAAKKAAETRAAKKAKPILEGRGSSPAGALENGSPTSAAAEETPGGAAPGDGGMFPLPGKPEVIADYRAVCAKLGHAPGRNEFIKVATTGRRYEKLWANWAKFMDALKSAEPSADSTAAQPQAGPSSPSEASETAARAVETAPGSLGLLSDEMSSTSYRSARADMPPPGAIPPEQAAALAAPLPEPSSNDSTAPQEPPSPPPPPLAGAEPAAAVEPPREVKYLLVDADTSETLASSRQPYTVGEIVGSHRVIAQAGDLAFTARRRWRVYDPAGKFLDYVDSLGNVGSAIHLGDAEYVVYEIADGCKAFAAPRRAHIATEA